MTTSMFESIELVVEKFQLEKGYQIETKNHKDRMCLIDGISKITKKEESYLIYDCSKENDNFHF